MLFSTLLGAFLAQNALASLEAGRANSGLESEFWSCESGGSRCHSSFLQFDAKPAKRRQGRAGTLPKVYVYDLPARVTVDSGPGAGEQTGRDVIVRDCICEGMEVGSDEELKCIFGDLMKVSMSFSADGSSEYNLRDIKQFQLGCIFYTSLQRWPRRVYDPAEADLFFIPSFMNDGYHRINQTLCPDADFLVQRLPYLDADTASRHFWVSPNTGWVGQVCDVFSSQSEDPSPSARLLAKTTKLALEDRSSGGSFGTEEWDRGTKLMPTQQGVPRAENLHSIPYPSMLSGLDASSMESWRQWVESPEPRPFVASALWGFHGLASSVERRVKLTVQCVTKPKECLFIDIVHRNMTNTEILTSAYDKSTFCLQPPGDTPSRKGIVDAIMFGCIPVLFTEDQAQLWPWHVGRWEDVAVLLDAGSQDVIGHLRSIPESEVRRLRGNIAGLMPRLLYNMPGQPAPDDALATTLDAIWKLAS